MGRRVCHEVKSFAGHALFGDLPRWFNKDVSSMQADGADVPELSSQASCLAAVPRKHLE